MRLQRFLKAQKSLLKTSESSRFLNSALFWCFEKKFFGVEWWNIILNFSTFSVRGCWGQPMSFFWKLVDETQIPKPPEATRHHTPIKLLILLRLRADLLCTLHYETPCSMSFLTSFVFIQTFGIVTKACQLLANRHLIRFEWPAGYKSTSQIYSWIILTFLGLVG